MTEENRNQPEDPSGVDKLLSRFGPVPESTQRRAPGPSAKGRPRPGPAGHPARGGAPGPRPTQRGSAARPSPAPAEPAPLFEAAPDSVFGDSSVVEAAAPSRVAVQTAPSPQPEDDHVHVVTLEALSNEPPVEVIDRRDWVRVPRRTGPTFRFLLVGFVSVIAIFAVATRVNTWWGDQFDPPGEPGEPIEFEIASGDTANDVTQDLFASGVIANPTLFRYWVADNATGDFQAGQYTCLQENMSFEEALDCLEGQGPVPPSFFSVTIPEGLRLTEIIDVLNRQNPAWSEANLRQDLLADLVSVDLDGVPDEALPGSPDPTNSGLEGLLFPATYQVDERDIDNTRDILRRMADTMEARYLGLVEEIGRAPVIEELGLTDYEVITLASLVEEEYRVQEDLGRISRVIYNRLLAGESLGIDASSCYAAQIPCADLTREVLESDSPWNTRNTSNLGLPPTPIASPGEAALRAALQPEEGDWLFYVLTDADGSHSFAATAAEHAANVAICVERGLGCG